MARTTREQMKTRKLRAMSAAERADYERGYAEAKVAAEVGARVWEARKAAGLTQRELAAQMGTSQAAVARLEAGGVGATLTMLHRAAGALGMELSVELRPSA